MNVKIALVVAVLGWCSLSPSAQARVLIYPTVARTLPNRFVAANWHLSDPAFRAKHAAAVTFDKGVGGPFAADEPSWHIASDQPQPGYWHTEVKLEAGHTYLAGAWVRFPNAKILLFFGGQEEATKRDWQHRLYYFAGFNAQLKPYFGDRLVARLSDDPNVWKLMYTSFVAPKLRSDHARVELGLYLAAGDLTFSEPFLVDVTDGVRTLDLEVIDSKPVAALTVSEIDTRDVRWTKRFDTPVTAWKTTLPPSCDAFRGLEAQRPKGHQVRVEYADGTSEIVAAPLDNVFH